MSDIGKPERATQNRVITLFREELDYRYLGDWTDPADLRSSAVPSACRRIDPTAILA